MFVEKTAHNFYQLFSGINDKKFFLQIVNRDGSLKYSFESSELDMTDVRTISLGIMDACYDFFDPANFKFDDDFVLSTVEPFLIRRYGEKANFEKREVVKCQSFEELNLPAMNSTIFMESFLPFEKPLKKHESPPTPPWENPNFQNLYNVDAWFSKMDTWHGYAE